MIIPEVSPALDCVQTANGFQYELLLRAPEGLPAITKIRLGPYFFRPEFQPRPFSFPFNLLGLSRGGPEAGFWMTARTPRGWSRWHWEVAEDEVDSPAYLAATGTLAPGAAGLFKFVSFYAPGGLRTGLELWRGGTHRDCGVSGPNYERFFALGHEL